MVEAGGRRQYDGSDPGEPEHVFQVNGAQGGLARNEKEPAAFLEYDVRGSLQQIAACARRYGGERCHGAWADHHRPEPA